MSIKEHAGGSAFFSTYPLWGGFKWKPKARSPSSSLLPLPFWGEGSPTKVDPGKEGHPYSNLSTEDLERNPSIVEGFPQTRHTLPSCRTHKVLRVLQPGPSGLPRGDGIIRRNSTVLPFLFLMGGPFSGRRLAWIFGIWI